MSLVLAFPKRPPGPSAPDTPAVDSVHAASVPRSEGPALPPLSAGLPNTTPESLHALWVNVLLWGLRDAMDGTEREWVGSDDFYLCAEFAGIDEVIAERISALFWEDKLNRSMFSYTMFADEREHRAA